MDPISLAMGLATYVPGIVRWLSGSDKAEAAATAIVDVAQAVTGKSGAEVVPALQADPALVLEFRKALLAQEAQLDALCFADVADARKRDSGLATHNYRADSMYILAVLLVGALVYVVLRSDLDEYAKGIVTLVLGRFLGYLDNIYSFEFGTTRTSKVKDATIEQLSR